MLYTARDSIKTRSIRFNIAGVYTSVVFLTIGQTTLWIQMRTSSPALQLLKASGSIGARLKKTSQRDFKNRIFSELSKPTRDSLYLSPSAWLVQIGSWESLIWQKRKRTGCSRRAWQVSRVNYVNTSLKRCEFHEREFLPHRCLCGFRNMNEHDTKDKTPKNKESANFMSPTDPNSAHLYLTCWSLNVCACSLILLATHYIKF